MTTSEEFLNSTLPNEIDFRRRILEAQHKKKGRTGSDLDRVVALELWDKYGSVHAVALRGYYPDLEGWLGDRNPAYVRKSTSQAPAQNHSKPEVGNEEERGRRHPNFFLPLL